MYFALHFFLYDAIFLVTLHSQSGGFIKRWFKWPDWDAHVVSNQGKSPFDSKHIMLTMRGITRNILLVALLDLHGILTMAESIEKVSQAEFDEPLYYHQMDHHKSSSSSPEEIPTATLTPDVDSGFSVLGEIWQALKNYASDFGERSGFIEWWWGE